MDIKSVQKQLKNSNLSGRIFTLGNLFIGEDILKEENRIYELTGFSGSSAMLFVTPTKSYLFIDGRYELQAKKEINVRQTEIIKLPKVSFTDCEEWLKKNFGKNTSRINYNPWTISMEELKELSTLLPKAEFVPVSNPETLLCSKKTKVFLHQKKFTGLTAKNKLAIFTRHIKKAGLDAYLVTSAANVSWLLNLRSNALPYSPIVRAYALIEKNGTYKIFAEHTDLPNAEPFDKLQEILPKYQRLGADFSTAPAILSTYKADIINVFDKITNLKSVKNQTELKGMYNAHIRDGAALTKFLFWLNKNYKAKTETEIAEKLLAFRKKEPNFFAESFATISATGKNAAIVHYHAPEKNSTVLKKNNLLLLDSGAQYYDGTTDVTRTIALGTPSADMIEKNTLVLKAHIALATAVFHKNTAGNELDLIARQPLLKHGLDYEHGTGHGVGYFSNVHEGPARISIHAKSSAPLKAGMITSIEPGYYKENAFGIRIENLYAVKTCKNPKFLKFDPLTLIPIDKRLINKYLLTADETAWLNQYHKQVFSSLKKYLTKQELEWLRDACAAI